MTSPDQVQCDIDEIRQGARILEGLERDAEAIQSLANDANPDPGTWGLIGIPFAIWYGNTADDIKDNLGLITECLGTKAAGLTLTADDYEECDQGLSDALTEIEGLLDDVATPGVGLRVGPVDVARFDHRQDLPLASPLAAGAQSVVTLFDTGDWSELHSIKDSALTLGTMGAAFAFDPFHVLISNGLGFLIDLIQPLEDALAWVTGNPERMAGEISKWERVGQAQEPMAAAVLGVSENGLATWQGLAADQAKQRFRSFAEGIAGTGDDVGKVVYILQIAKTTMEIAQSFVIGLIATFVEWLVYTWVAALASAPATFGGSTAAASGATAIRFGHVMMRLRNFITRVVMILRRLRWLLTKLQRKSMRRVQASFQLRDRGRFVTGWIGSRRALYESVTNWRTYYDPAQRVVGSLIDQGAGAFDDGGFVPTSEAGDRADQLDPDG